MLWNYYCPHTTMYTCDWIVECHCFIACCYAWGSFTEARAVPVSVSIIGCNNHPPTHPPTCMWYSRKCSKISQNPAANFVHIPNAISSSVADNCKCIALMVFLNPVKQKIMQGGTNEVSKYHGNLCTCACKFCHNDNKIKVNTISQIDYDSIL